MSFWKRHGQSLALAQIEKRHANARKKELRDAMGFWQDLKDVLSGKPAPAVNKDAAVGTELYGASDGWGVSASGVPVNAFTALQENTVIACVNILSEDIAKLPIRMFRRKPDGGKEQVFDHYLAKLLDKPNNWETKFEFIEMMMSALLLRGNAYAVILRDERGRPEQLVPIHPDRVTLYEAPGGQYFFFVTRQGLHEMAVLKDEPLLIAAENIFHIRWLSTWSSLLGTSRIGLIRESIGLAMALEQHQARLMGQGARPGGVLETEAKLNKETYDRLHSAWQPAYGGFRNAGKTVILEQGVTFKPITMTNTDAQFTENREFQVRVVARGFRIPPHKLGLPVEGAATGLVQYDQQYLNDTILSWTERWTAKLHELGDVDGRELFVEFDHDHFLKADIKTRYDAWRAGISGSFLKPNDARVAEGLPKVEGGDDVYQPLNMVKLGTPPEPKAGAGGVGSDTTGKPAPGGDGDPHGKPESNDS